MSLFPAQRPLRTALLRMCAVVGVASLGACGGVSAGARSTAAGQPPAPGTALVRVNQVGYAPSGHRAAVLFARTAAQDAAFTVISVSTGAAVLHGTAGHRLPAWSAQYPYAYPLDITPLTAPGRYVIQVGGTASPPFVLAAPAALNAPLITATVRALRVQRDGPQVDSSLLSRGPSHLDDAHAKLYAIPKMRHGLIAGPLHPAGGVVDVSGGWMDAGDTLKFAETGSFAELALLRALRDAPQNLGTAATQVAAEARFELTWLLKLWDPGRRRLIYQVGIGDGNGSTILGAHDVWRTPEHDGTLRATAHSVVRYLRYRPVFATTGPVSPNLAGRLAATYATASEVLRTSDPTTAARSLAAARSIYAAARTKHVGRLVTAVPYAYYPEVEWRDDMELGAIALAHATTGAEARRYLRAATSWATRYAVSPDNGTDSLNLFDVAAFAHDDIATSLRTAGLTHLNGISAGNMANDLKGQFKLAAAHARTDPFGYLGAYRDGDVVSHALGWALETTTIDRLDRNTALATQGQQQRDLVLGQNAWGTTFITGIGTTFPQCLHHPTANLSGSLNGQPPLLIGATVPGPDLAKVVNSEQQPSGARPCSRTASLRQFDSHDARYADEVKASANVEPSIDLEALALLTFAQPAP